MQSTRDGSRGKGERVHIFANFFQALFVGYAETLLLIDDHQAEILEADIFGEQAMCADDDIHLARFECCENLLLLRGGAKAAQHLDTHGKGGERSEEHTS